MSLFPQNALKPGVRKREVFGWAMYDFANSGYTTVVLTAVFSAYFVGGVAGGEAWGTLAWTSALAVSSLIVMLTMPAIGAYADLRAVKKRLLMLSTLGCVAGTAALAGAGPGDVAWALVAIVLSNVFYTYGESLIAAFLPELASEERMGSVSGWGWGFGYLGGMLTLGLSLWYVLWAQGQGLPAAHFVPVSMFITAGVFGASAMVTFVLLKERARPQVRATKEAGLKASLARLKRTWREARSFQDFTALLACSVAYQAGIAVVIALAAVYAEQVLGFQQTETMMLIFLVNIAAALGAFAWGYVQDIIGHRPALAITLAGWIVMIVLAALATGPGLFWVAAVIAGLCMGSSQSAGRALAGALAPELRRAEFFGLWMFAVRLSAIIGPMTYGLVTWLTDGNHRLAIVSTGVFFVAGLGLLTLVNVQRGIAAAAAANARASASSS
ncbi:UMF1 family MFS transporter [Hydrogenophaga palleronii]|uniref:UMF1 family MFS transporter n=1 Tax=Hydrogenophaga palleronii TaxID=65655 RepID=A0ABU1WK38_9BURK|nr:MFS transporter [Hydrogenophaga palleronii]MDR7149424.1 UMF1 family MFS transporter [Hydrogenophaga palleronii]